MMSIFSKDDRETLRALDDVRTVDIDVPEWACTVRLRSMTAAERLAFIEFRKTHEQADCAAFVVVKTAIDAKGDHAFDDDDVAWLAKKNESILIALMKHAVDLNVLELSAIEARRKNSASAMNGASPSTSHNASAA